MKFAVCTTMWDETSEKLQIHASSSKLATRVVDGDEHPGEGVAREQQLQSGGMVDMHRLQHQLERPRGVGLLLRAKHVEMRKEELQKRGQARFCELVHTRRLRQQQRERLDEGGDFL